MIPRSIIPVWVEDRKGILPFSEMSWALHVKPTPKFKPKRRKPLPISSRWEMWLMSG